MNELSLKITNEQKHIPFTPVAKNLSVSEKQKMADVSKQFESLLTSMMLKSMNQTTGGMFGEDSFGGDFFDSIFQYEIADKISQGTGLGVADEIYKRLTGEKLSTEVLNPKLNPIIKQPKIEVTTSTLEIPLVKPSNQSLDRLSKYDEIIDHASETYGVDKNIIKSVILAESSAKENAVSTASAKGLMQIIDSTAKYLGINNVWDPKENIMGGAKYLSELLRKYNGNLKFALAGYNAGPGNVDKYNGIPPFTETQTYVKRVIGYLKNFEEPKNVL
ncbi:MAG: murein transglycosylase [Ignavibacteriales bacterium]|jgi:Rod binding domain-containing protein|nr:transglycosylase SLT domain-containing protein [Ignavibacterium sp.]RPI62892.1 MAG: murein transglycosylase [Ignavibacteriales bacterium]